MAVENRWGVERLEGRRVLGEREKRRRGKREDKIKIICDCVSFMLCSFLCWLYNIDIEAQKIFYLIIINYRFGCRKSKALFGFSF